MEGVKQDLGLGAFFSEVDSNILKERKKQFCLQKVSGAWSLEKEEGEGLSVYILNKQWVLNIPIVAQAMEWEPFKHSPRSHSCLLVQKVLLKYLRQLRTSSFYLSDLCP